MIDVNLLKIKREFIIIKKRFLNEKSNYSYTKEEYDINFIIDNFEYFNDITIDQYSRFGFVISYNIYYKNIKIYDITEKVTHKNRYKMNDLILSDLNINRYRKICHERLLPLKEIEY